MAFHLLTEVKKGKKKEKEKEKEKEMLIWNRY